LGKVVRLMLESTFMRKLVYTNTLVLICIIFTTATFLDLVLALAITGDVYGTDYIHLGTRFIVCVFVSLSLLVFRFFKRLPFAAVIGIHFFAVIIFAVLYVWISGFFIELHPQAMFYMVRSILIIYPFIGIGCIIADRMMKGRKK